MQTNQAIKGLMEGKIKQGNPTTKIFVTKSAQCSNQPRMGCTCRYPKAPTTSIMNRIYMTNRILALNALHIKSQPS